MAKNYRVMLVIFITFSGSAYPMHERLVVAVPRVLPLLHRAVPVVRQMALLAGSPVATVDRRLFDEKKIAWCHQVSDEVFGGDELLRRKDEHLREFLKRYHVNAEKRAVFLALISDQSVSLVNKDRAVKQLIEEAYLNALRMGNSVRVNRFMRLGANPKELVFHSDSDTEEE